MSILAVGISHRSAPVSILEQLAMDAAQRDDLARDLAQSPALGESMVLATCNRVEAYTTTSSFHEGVNTIVDHLVRLSGIDEDTLRGHLYVRFADAAAEHLMAVTSGLDSMVVGEQQIIGQVRSAYTAACENHTLGPTLHSLAQAALHAGKRIHSETAVDTVAPSTVSVALGHAHDVMGGFDGARVVLLGAGAMATLAATHLGHSDVEALWVANRTRSNAERLVTHAHEAGMRQASAIDFDSRSTATQAADLVVSATGAGYYVVTPTDVSDHTVCVDLSLPRDIDPEVPGTLINLETLAANAASAGAETAALAIVHEELEKFTSSQRVRDIAPALSALHTHSQQIVTTELDRLTHKLDLTDTQQAEVETTLRRVVSKLLHQPTIHMKELAATSGSLSYDTALQQLFGLDQTPRSVRTPAEALPTTATFNEVTGK